MDDNKIITDEMVREVREIMKKEVKSKEDNEKIEELLRLRNAENMLNSSGVDWGQASVDALKRHTSKDESGESNSKHI